MCLVIHVWKNTVGKQMTKLLIDLLLLLVLANRLTSPHLLGEEDLFKT